MCSEGGVCVCMCVEVRGCSVCSEGDACVCMCVEVRGVHVCGGEGGACVWR